MIGVDPQTLRRAFGTFMTGVTVVTTRADNGSFVGFTANSFTSVSMDPPLLLVCPGKHLQFFDVFESVSHFAVSVLAEGQESVSNTFASEPGDRFAHTHWSGDAYGSPLIHDACATFSCRVHQRLTAGDHMVLIGEVLDLECNNKNGLGYGSNGYFSLSKEQKADTSNQSGITGITGAIVKTGNELLVVPQGQKLTLPEIKQQGSDGARSALQKHFIQSGLDITLGPVYSIYDDTGNGKRYTYFLGNTSDNTDNKLGTFTSINSLNTDSFRDTAQSIMMDRFVTEVQSDVFGLYVGDTESGDVHHQNKNRTS